MYTYNYTFLGLKKTKQLELKRGDRKEIAVFFTPIFLQQNDNKKCS